MGLWADIFALHFLGIEWVIFPIFFAGKKFIEWAKTSVNDFTNNYLIRDGHERCDDPFVNNKIEAFYEKMRHEEDDEITNQSSLF